MALLLDQSLNLKTSDEERIANLRFFAVHGLESEGGRLCAKALLNAAERTALRLSLDASCLKPMWKRLETGDVPADEISRVFKSEKAIEKTRKSMEKAAADLDFIEAARFRDELADLQSLLRSKL